MSFVASHKTKNDPCQKNKSMYDEVSQAVIHRITTGSTPDDRLPRLKLAEELAQTAAR